MITQSLLKYFIYSLGFWDTICSCFSSYLDQYTFSVSSFSLNFLTHSTFCAPWLRPCTSSLLTFGFQDYSFKIFNSNPDDPLELYTHIGNFVFGITSWISSQKYKIGILKSKCLLENPKCY